MKPDLDAIRARCEAATPGPWGFSSFERRYILDDTTDVVGEVAPTDTGAAITVFSVATGALEDAEFIALARTDIPALLAHVDMLEHMLAEERENVDTLRERVAELEGRGFLPPINAEHEAIVDGMLAKAHEGAAKRPIGTYSPGETEWANRIAHAEARFVEEYDAHQETRRLLTDLFYKQLKADAEQMRSYGIGQVGVRKLLEQYRDEELSLGKVVDLLRAAAREMAREQVEELKARIADLEAARNDETFDGTDAAHPAWWRGNDAGVRGAVNAVHRMLADAIPDSGAFGAEELNDLHARIKSMLAEAAELKARIVTLEAMR